MEEYFKLLESLVAIPSVSGDEAAAADCLAAFLTARGHEVHRKINNIWVESEAPGAKPTLLLNAHIDTVKPAAAWVRDPFKPTLEGDKLYGLGTNDDGGSLVSLLAAYERLIAREQPYRLVYSATAGEETTAPDGIVAVLPEFGDVAFAVVGEPTGMRVAVAERGLLVLDCAAAGVTGHAAREEGVNAIYEALSDIDWFRSYRFDKVSEYLGPVKMTVTMIQAGTQHNVVPAECRFVVDVRPNGEYTNREILDVILANVKCSVAPRSMKHNSSSIPMDHPAVQRALSIGLETFGSPTTSNQTECPFSSFKLGPGQSSRSHTADEYICFSEISSAVDIYVQLLDGLVL